MDKIQKQHWYNQSSKEVVGALDTDIEQGLAPAEVSSRLAHFGNNRLESTKGASVFKIFFGQFKDVLIIILLLAASVSLVLGFIESGHASTESLLIYAIVFAIAIVGFFNEYRAEKTVEALRSLVAYRTKVKRGGHVIEIDVEDLVPGDIVIIEEGQKIPADMRLLLAETLMVNEASLTGESSVADKDSEQLGQTLALGDQRNMLFSGTYVSSGTGVAVVVETGGSTQLGKIAQLVDGVESEPTPMQRKLDALGKKLGIIVIILCVVVFLVELFFDKQALSQNLASRLIFSFTAAVALAVAAIPEGLAFVVRISLALGARRMATQNALVRKLSAVEALGSTDVICSDKTGTLTKGEMTVRKLYVEDQIVEVEGEGYGTAGKIIRSAALSETSLNQLFTAGALCNNAHLKHGKVIGDPTEGSLLISAAKGKIEYHELQQLYPRVKEFPFTSDRKMMSTIQKSKQGYLVTAKGAPDVLLEHCSHVLQGGKRVALTPAHRKKIEAANKSFAQEALRVLAFAIKEEKTLPQKAQSAETGLTFVGLQAMIDPPRREVAAVIERVQAEAGMRVVMITGDHIDTARAIALQLGIKGNSITGMELDKLSQSEFERRVETLGVYARVNPEHKIRIVQALKKHGHQVAMTGDGVNDAPAIKAADIGIAMGITGTDVTKEAADLILLDDQFTTIIKAIEEGRGIYDNVRKFVNFLLSANIAEVLTILAGIIFARKLLLSPSQILFINIVTDGLPAIALGSDPAAKTIMKHLPSKYQEAIINKRTWFEIFIFGTLMTIALLTLYKTMPAEIATSVVFTGMVVFELVRLVDIRTDYKIAWFSNPLLTVAIVASLLLQLSVIYIPQFAKVFEVVPFGHQPWLYIAGMSIALVLIMKLLNKPLDLLGKEN